MQTRQPYFWVRFILGIEILALTLKDSEAKPYRTKKGNTHLQEQYADNLTIFLEYTNGEDVRKAISIIYVLNVLDEFFVLSELGVNKSKTMLSVFGTSLDSSDLAEALGLK